LLIALYHKVKVGYYSQIESNIEFSFAKTANNLYLHDSKR
jgi:hypothetical protein